MPHSLRSKLSGLRYKGIITDKDYQRLCKALDMEKAIEDIKAEIETMADLSAKTNDKTLFGGLELALGVIDKHMGKENG